MSDQEEYEKERDGDGCVFFKAQHDCWTYYALLTNGLEICFCEIGNSSEEWVDLLMVNDEDENRRFIGRRRWVSVRREHIVCISEEDS